MQFTACDFGNGMHCVWAGGPKNFYSSHNWDGIANVKEGLCKESRLCSNQYRSVGLRTVAWRWGKKEVPIEPLGSASRIVDHSTLRILCQIIETRFFQTFRWHLIVHRPVTKRKWKYHMVGIDNWKMGMVVNPSLCDSRQEYRLMLGRVAPFWIPGRTTNTIFFSFCLLKNQWFLVKNQLLTQFSSVSFL